MHVIQLTHANEEHMKRANDDKAQFWAESHNFASEVESLKSKLANISFGWGASASCSCAPLVFTEGSIPTRSAAAM